MHLHSVADNSLTCARFPVFYFLKYLVQISQINIVILVWVAKDSKARGMG